MMHRAMTKVKSSQREECLDMLDIPPGDLLNPAQIFMPNCNPLSPTVMFSQLKLSIYCFMTHSQDIKL